MSRGKSTRTCAPTGERRNDMKEYPKIETLYRRDDATHKVVQGDIRLPEVVLIKSWLVTEKIDGTNIRVGLKADGSVEYGGRTDNAQIHPLLLKWLANNLPAAKLLAVFALGEEVTLFGEGYGP